jgi:hypothetical protein
MKTVKTMMVMAALSVTISAKADLGDARRTTAEKYTLMPHSGNPELTRNMESYRNNEGYSVGEGYNDFDIACVVFYHSKETGRRLTQEEIDHFFALNLVPPLRLGSYWTKEASDTDSFWISKDGRYSVTLFDDGLRIYDNWRQSQQKDGAYSYVQP